MPVLRGNLLFIHIPKTGGGSIESALGLARLDGGWPGRNFHRKLLVRAAARVRPREQLSLHGHSCLKVTLQHLTLNELLGLGLLTPKDIYEDFTCFCVVRNPFDRAISQWRSHGRMAQYPDVNDFIRDWLTDNRVRKTHEEMAHSRPQTDYLAISDFYMASYDRPPEIARLRFEDLEAEYRRFVRGRSDALLELPHMHRGSGPRTSYRQLLDTDSRRLIEKHYHADLEQFTYQW